MNPVIDCGPNGYGYDKLGDRYKEISPVEHVHSGIVPTLFFHGIADTTVPFKNAEDFTAKMKAAGNYCKIVPFKGMNHGFFNFGRNNNVPYYTLCSDFVGSTTYFKSDQSYCQNMTPKHGVLKKKNRLAFSLGFFARKVCFVCALPV